MARTLDIFEPVVDPTLGTTVQRAARNHALATGHLDSLPTAETMDRGALAFVPGAEGEATADALYWGRRAADGTKEWVEFGATADALTFIVNGNGSEISTGVVGDLSVPYACTITGVRALADQVGSIVVDVWKDGIANYPPTNSDSITASAPITISSDDVSEDLVLTGWVTSISAGDILRFNVDSCSTITRCTLSIGVTRTP
jgi:hypothetical protein